MAEGINILAFHESNRRLNEKGWKIPAAAKELVVFVQLSIITKEPPFFSIEWAKVVPARPWPTIIKSTLVKFENK